MKAKFHDTIIAESDQTVVVEGRHYFPPDSVKREFLKQSAFQTRSHCKGEARFFNIAANGDWVADAAWYYPEPDDDCRRIKDYVAFWKDIEVVE